MKGKAKIPVPLNQRVTFKVLLQKRRRLQVPRVVRWQFKLETSQVMKVTLSVIGMVGTRESFFGRMHRDGSLVVPPLVVDLLKRDEPNLDGCALEVTLEPA